MISNELAIVMALIEKTKERMTINRLSEELNIDYKNVYTIVKRLEKDNLVILEKIGRGYQCVLNKKVHPTIFEAEYQRREKIFKKSDFKVIYNRLKNLSFPFIALIFGSYARGNETKASDIDLMVICEKGRDVDIQRIISLFPLDIHLVSFNFEEFNSMAKTKEFNVVGEALVNNIILIGIEDYYRMLENVG